MVLGVNDGGGEKDKPPELPSGDGSTGSGSGGGGSGDLLTTLPGPVIRLLLILALPITWLRTVLEVLLWKNGRRVESWMVFVGWWAICLGGKHAFRYLLPPLLFAPLLPLSRLSLGSSKTPPPSTPAIPSTHDTLLATLSDLHTIHALLPPSPLPTFKSTYDRFALLGPLRLTRGLVVIWTTWIILGRYITGYTPLLAILGSVVLLLPSPPLAHLVDTLSKSLAVRRSVALTFLFVFGSPPETSYRLSNVSDWSIRTWLSSKWATSRRPSLTWSFRPPNPLRASALSGSALDDSPDQDQEITTGEPLYFRFEVHENQRWWMGLDWTSALLPQERPSWCDNHLLPVSPPPSFCLPSDTSIVLPCPTPTDPKAQERRTAHWKWIDDDWVIVRVTPGAPSSGGLSTSPVAPPAAIVEGQETGGYALGSSPPTLSQLGTSPSKLNTPEDTFASATARAHGYAEAAFAKGLERLKARTGSPIATAPRGGAGNRASLDLGRRRTGSQASEDLGSIDEHLANAGAGAGGGAGGGVPETIVERDEATDGDGWVYGDNKWEGMGPRGGLGKFTRRRRWQRRAVCTETIIKIPSDAAPMSPTTPNSAVPIISTTTTDVAVDVPPVQAPPLGRGRSHDRVPSSPTKEREVITIIPEVAAAEPSRGHIASGSFSSSGQSRDDVLRQRLKKAMGSVGG